MRTAGDIVKRALVRCGALPAGETPTAAEMEDALDTLRDMLDSWSIEPLIVFTVVIAGPTEPLYLLPGWFHAITLNLAVHLCGEYGFLVSDDLASLAIAAKASIKRANIKATCLTFDEALL